MSLCSATSSSGTPEFVIGFDRRGSTVIVRHRAFRLEDGCLVGTDDGHGIAVALCPIEDVTDRVRVRIWVSDAGLGLGPTYHATEEVAATVTLDTDGTPSSIEIERRELTLEVSP